MVLKPGCQVAVPCLCWPLQAKVRTLKQTLSDIFLLMKGSAACVVSPQHSSLLVTSEDVLVMSSVLFFVLACVAGVFAHQAVESW